MERTCCPFFNYFLKVGLYDLLPSVSVSLLFLLDNEVSSLTRGMIGTLAQSLSLSRASDFLLSQLETEYCQSHDQSYVTTDG
jgi:hypothetical protein